MYKNNANYMSISKGEFSNIFNPERKSQLYLDVQSVNTVLFFPELNQLSLEVFVNTCQPGNIGLSILWNVSIWCVCNYKTCRSK